MNTAAHRPPTGGVNTRQLWAAVAVLGIAVVALGASLVHIQTRPADGHMALAALDPLAAITQESALAEPVTALPVTTVGQGETVLVTPVPSAPAQTTPSASAATVRKKPSTPVTEAPAAPPMAPPRASAPPAAVVIGTTSNAPMVLTEAGPLVSRPLASAPQRTICTTCGRVESVSAIERKGDAQGVGAVAGGVLGAVLGNQIGKGNGRAIATVVGAVGGGLAGNAIEKNTSKTIAYQVQVRMQDGSLRTVQQSSAPAIGSSVVVEGQQIRSADGAAPRSQRSTPAPVLVPQAKVYNSERY